MNIKDAELHSGVSKRNIRFYEQKGLLHPGRNEENDYREYSDADIETLKLIRILRMVNMPLEQIREVLQGQVSLNTAAATHRQKLKLQMKQLETALRFCEELQTADAGALDVDELLGRMDEPENRRLLFRHWGSDYADEVRKAVISLALGLVPPLVGFIAGLIVMGLNTLFPIVSFLIGPLLLIYWGALGYTLCSSGYRFRNALLVHTIPAVAFALYAYSRYFSGEPLPELLELFTIGCQMPLLFTFMPQTELIGLPFLKAALPLLLLFFSFCAGGTIAKLRSARAAKG